MNSIQPHTLNDSPREAFQTKKWGTLDQVQRVGWGRGKKITSLSLEKLKIGGGSTVGQITGSHGLNSRWADNENVLTQPIFELEKCSLHENGVEFCQK